MGGRSLRALCCAVLVATGMLVTLSGSASGADWPNLPWVDLLPPAPSSSSVQPKPVANCRKPGLRCVRTEIKRMKKLQARLGCDHRAVFATTYLKLTGQLQRSLRSEPHLFRYPRYLYIEDALFANVYFRSVRARNLGRPVPEAWRIAFDTAASGDANGAQDMLLGINAHVQNDMPFVLAALGQRAPDGTSRKPDHDVMNRVLSAGYERVVAAVKRRYDPLLDVTNSPATPLDDAAGLEMVRGWREDVWRNAERLLNASSDAERAQVASQIEQNAAVWAQSIAAPQEPGYRSQRDAYCASALGKR